MQTILIVEDDEALRTSLYFELQQEGYHILAAENGRNALELLRNNSVDLILLDVNLPDTDGFSLCNTMKAIQKTLVIFLTARDMEQDELMGFEQGADDYITKPFRLSLLRKRIQAVLRRRESGNVYSDGYLTIDFDSRLASRQNEVLRFTPTEFKLLFLFTSNAGKVLTRKLLLEKLWDNSGNFVDEHALTVNINRLRGKIENAEHKYIHTIHGIGYMWMYQQEQ